MTHLDTAPTRGLCMPFFRVFSNDLFHLSFFPFSFEETLQKPYLNELGGENEKERWKIASDAEKEGRWKVCGQREERCNEKKTRMMMKEDEKRGQMKKKDEK